MAEFYTTRLGGSHFIHSRSLLFEGNASLKCVYSGLTPLSAVFQTYHDGVWLLQGAQCGLGGSHFYTYNSGFPCAFICLSFMLMMWISAVHNRVIQFTCLVYITSLLIWRRDNILLADIRILTICIINLYILHGFFFCFNLGIDSTTKPVHF